MVQQHMCRLVVVLVLLLRLLLLLLLVVPSQHLAALAGSSEA
jgi:hypothetical protein